MPYNHVKHRFEHWDNLEWAYADFAAHALMGSILEMGKDNDGGSPFDRLCRSSLRFSLFRKTRHFYLRTYANYNYNHETQCFRVIWEAKIAKDKCRVVRESREILSFIEKCKSFVDTATFGAKHIDTRGVCACAWCGLVDYWNPELCVDISICPDCKRRQESNWSYDEKSHDWISPRKRNRVSTRKPNWSSRAYKESDNYIRHLIANGTSLSNKDIPSELVSLKREQLKLSRKMRENRNAKQG